MLDFPGYSLSGAAASFFFVLLTMKPSDDFRVLGPAYPVLARVGEDALLTCGLVPRRAAAHMEVRWFRWGPSERVLSARRDGAEVPGVQTEDYRGRVEWAEDGLAEGRVALKLRGVRPSDAGRYWCRFQDGSSCAESSLLLQVAGLGSAPRIHVEQSGGGEIRLVCTAEGWFPEPEVHWENSRGERLLTSSEDHIQGEDGSFYVEATLVLRNASTETVLCFVHNPVLAEGKGADISIPEKLQTELASLKVIGPSQPLLVRVGEDIRFTCHLFPKANAESMEVRWVRSHHYPAVSVYMGGDHVSAEQMAEYRRRTVLVTDAIREGSLTLQIQDARTSDDGQYRCLFGKDGVYQENSLDLKIVALGSPPRIALAGLQDGGVRLRCASQGWFPQPRVQWTDAGGKAAPSSSQVLTQDSRGLFRVEAFLWVANSSVGTVTCSVGNPLLREERTATFPLADSRMTFLWKILLILGLLLLVTVGLIKRKSCGTGNVTPDPNTAHPELFSLRKRSVGPTDSHATRRSRRFGGLLFASGQEGLLSGGW